MLERLDCQKCGENLVKEGDRSIFEDLIAEENSKKPGFLQKGVSKVKSAFGALFYG